MHRVVVVGAGFGGIAAAKSAVRHGAAVTLVDRRNYTTFQPLLYQVATAGLDSGDVAHTIRAIFRDDPLVDVRMGTVDHVDAIDRCVVFHDGASLSYDALILASGATTHWFGVPGAPEHAHPLYTLDDAVALRSHVLRCFEKAEAEPASAADGSLTFVVVGGGPTGVEISGALTELFRVVLAKDFRHVAPAVARVILLEMGDSLLGSFRPPSSRHAHLALASRGVEIRTGARVVHVEPTAVHLATGDVIPTRTVIWTAGVQAEALGASLGVRTTRAGRVSVGRDLSVPGHPEVFAIGDVAAIPGRRETTLPQLAPVALQSGRHAAINALRVLDGRRTRPFRYVDKGTMATIGRRAAVADLRGGLTLCGTPAWLAWLFLHLVYLIGFRRRLHVLTQWTWNYLTWNWGPRLITRGDRWPEAGEARGPTGSNERKTDRPEQATAPSTSRAARPSSSRAPSG